MAIASENVFPKVRFSEEAAPSTPASGEAVIYVKSDGKLYLKDDAGTETDLTAAGGGGTDTFGTELVHVRDEKTAGTHAGASSTGSWLTRVLNTVKTNEVSGASLSSNQLTLPAGTYFAQGRAPNVMGLSHHSRLRDITNTATLLVGSSGYSDQNGGGASDSVVFGRFTLAGTAAIELQQRVSAAKATNGLGNANNFGEVEVYAELMVWKVA